MDSKSNTRIAVRFNHDLFAHEVFDHEVVALNTLDGTYYAFGGSAVSLWEDLISRRSIARIVSALEAAHRGSEVDVAGSVASFVEALLAEQILLPAESENPGALRLSQDGSAAAFSPPTFEKHADMQELLTLDPIHGVDPQKGWPHS